MFRDAGHTPFVRSRRGKSATPTPSPSPAPRSSARLGGATPQPAPAPAAATSLLAFAPHPDLSALVLVLVRVLGAYFVTSQWDRDADEAYNYWEPAHFMLYGAGMQTWEANVRYMFRSYGFSGVGAALGFVLGGFHGDDKVTVLYRVRMALALGCAAAEAFLYTSVRQRFGARVALLMLAGSLLSVGMLFVAPALLPNSFTMVGFTLAWGLWLREQHAAAAAVAAGALALGFPFAALALPPLGLHMLGSTLPRQLLEGALRPLRPLWAWCAAPRAGAARRGPWDWAPLLGLLSAGAASLVLCTAYAACVDRLYYGVWASFQGNTLLYNLNLHSDGNGRGSDNFADPTVAGRTWYVKNLFYSHNVVALLALASPVLLLAAALLRGGCSARALAPSPATSWRAALAAQLWLYFAVFSLKAHKEERFMYPIYPLLPLLAALAVDALVEALAARCSALAWPAARAAARPLLLALLAALALAATALSLSRAVMLSSAYSGHVAVWTAFARASAFRLEAPGGGGEQPPLHAWAHPVRGLLGRDGAASAPPGVTVCAGQEWHRFPGSFFLPERTASESGGPAVLRYVRFEPPGVSHPCLPHAYNASSSAAAAAAPNALFNSDNAEVPEFFVQPGACHYLVDFLGRAGARATGSAMQPWFEQGSSGLAGGQCVAGWRAVFSAPFLDRAASEAGASQGASGTLRTLATRTFYVPWLTPQLQEWGTYYLLKKC